MSLRGVPIVNRQGGEDRGNKDQVGRPNPSKGGCASVLNEAEMGIRTCCIGSWFQPSPLSNLPISPS